VASGNFPSPLGAFDGVETPRIQMTLTTGIPEERCRRVDIGHAGHRAIDSWGWARREAEPHPAGAACRRVALPQQTSAPRRGSGVGDSPLGGWLPRRSGRPVAASDVCGVAYRGQANEEEGLAE
jgi:hypothetical protein